MSKTQAPVVNVNEVSRISTGTVLKGEINSPVDLRIDGIFEGRIFSSGRVVVGEKAEIKGEIFCENLDFWGKMDGSIYVRDTLTLKDTSRVKADLHIQHLVVEYGAQGQPDLRLTQFQEYSSHYSRTHRSNRHCQCYKNDRYGRAAYQNHCRQTFRIHHCRHSP